MGTTIFHIKNLGKHDPAKPQTLVSLEPQTELPPLIVGVLWPTYPPLPINTVDGQNPCITKDDDYPIIYRVLTIPGGAGFLPSTVGLHSRRVFIPSLPTAPPLYISGRRAPRYSRLGRCGMRVDDLVISKIMEKDSARSIFILNYKWSHNLYKWPKVNR